MQTFMSFVVVMIMVGGALLPVVMFAGLTLATVFGSAKPGGRGNRGRRYVSVTERSYDFDVDGR